MWSWGLDVAGDGVDDLERDGHGKRDCFWKGDTMGFGAGVQCVFLSSGSFFWYLSAWAGSKGRAVGKGRNRRHFSQYRDLRRRECTDAGSTASAARDRMVSAPPGRQGAVNMAQPYGLRPPIECSTLSPFHLAIVARKASPLIIIFSLPSHPPSRQCAYQLLNTPSTDQRILLVPRLSG